MLASVRQRFLTDYTRIRHAEGRGSQDAAYYLALLPDALAHHRLLIFERTSTDVAQTLVSAAPRLISAPSPNQRNSYAR